MMKGLSMFVLPELRYSYEALEPTISGETMRLHHDRHHARYVAVLNELTADTPLARESLEAVIKQAAIQGERKLFNNAGQAWNHAFFWESMTGEGRAPSGRLFDAIHDGFGSLEALGARFQSEGAAHFGSGWVWLVAKGKALAVTTTHDAETVITEPDVIPLLVCDVWEHAYYLDHKNDRAAFLSSWWRTLPNWAFAEQQFEAAAGAGRPWSYPQPTSGAKA
jgi:Fe-Mn family superoxide dismutase